MFSIKLNSIRKQERHLTATESVQDKSLDTRTPRIKWSVTHLCIPIHEGSSCFYPVSTLFMMLCINTTKTLTVLSLLWCKHVMWAVDGTH